MSLDCCVFALPVSGTGCLHHSWSSISSSSCWNTQISRFLGLGFVAAAPLELELFWFLFCFSLLLRFVLLFYVVFFFSFCCSEALGGKRCGPFAVVRFINPKGSGSGSITRKGLFNY